MMTRACTLLIAALWLASASWGQAAEPLLVDLSTASHKPTEVTTPAKAKVPAGAVELVAGQAGKACKFSFVESTGPQFFTASVNPKEDWDQYEGFSFWVKGDGSKNCGGLEFIDRDNFALRYGYCFPVNSTGWTKVTVPWSDLIPELSSPLVDARSGFSPSKFRHVWFGKWFYWREWPACSFTVERMQLEKKIDRDTTDYAPKQAPLARVLAKLRTKKPVTIVTMGDSLSDKRHWANREKLWSEVLVKRLKETYGSEVTLVNPAIGGTTLSQNIILIPRWMQDAPAPDLVAIWFGGNDWETGVRGPRYKQYLQAAVDRIRRETKGQSDVLVMTTCPGFKAWDTMDELCKAAHVVAQERKTGFADPAGAFHKAGSREEALKRQYWVWDNVHLGPGGHDLVADTVLRAIQSEGLADLKGAAEASWMKAPEMAEGETPLSSFEPGQEGIVACAAGKIVKEHATAGKQALRMDSSEKDYVNLSLEDRRTLGPLHENARFLVDVFNPQDREVAISVLVRDPQSKDYNTRYNGTLLVQPGKSTIDLDYTRLPRTGTEKSDKPDYINPKEITLFVLFLGPHGSGKPVTLFFDNVRLAEQRKPEGKQAAAPAAAPPPVAASAPVAPDGGEVLSSFEPGGPSLVTGNGQIVSEHATDGQHSFKVESDGQGYLGLHITEGAAMRKFKDYVLLKIDVFNPQDRPVVCTARIDDAGSKDYGSRYNDDGVAIAPGRCTFEINLTGLTKSNARNFADRQKLDLATVRLMTFCIAPTSKGVTLFFDNVRLEGSGLPTVAGLRAFDFGPPGAPVYPGFEGCTHQVSYTPDRGYGWIAPDHAQIAYMPDALTGDCASGREFRVKLANGAYEVNLCWDMFGLWGTLPTFTWRKLLINGKEVLGETLSGREFLAKHYLAHEDDEDLPGQDWWEKFIASHQKIHRFTAEVTDGLLHVEPQADEKFGRGICFVVVYPEGKRDEGRRFMETLAARRKARFNAEMVVHVPNVLRSLGERKPHAEREEYTGKPHAEREEYTLAEKARGFVPLVLHTEDDLAVTVRPPMRLVSSRIVVEAAQGERAAAQIGLHAVRDAEKVRFVTPGLAGPAGAEIPASAIQIRKVRNFLKGSGHGRMGNLLPYILQDFDTLDLKEGQARGIWLTIKVPEGTPPGKYTGGVFVKEHTGGLFDFPSALSIPIELTVHPFKLDKVTDITMSVTGSTAGTFTFLHPDLEDRWWQVAEMVMKDQAEHGMNAITGGPGAVLKGVKDGKAEIDYSRIDRWMALAMKHGLTMPGDSYQGLDVSGLPQDHSKDCVARCEAAAKERFGVGYEELLRIVYGDLASHAKERGWPQRVYYFLDEPRPEYGNVESCAELVKIRTRACPDTLFSGYYSTGAGRDVYFETMPVSIAHIDKLSLELVTKGKKQIWDYSGNRVRHDIGRWAFVAAKAGMRGFLRNGYMYVCSQPYFDFSDDESSWSVVYPSKDGISDTVGWERTAQGVADYRYLLTCQRLVREARRSGKAAEEADAAEAFMKASLATIAVEDKETARLSPRGYDEFRHALAGHIVALRRTIGAAR